MERAKDTTLLPLSSRPRGSASAALGSSHDMHEEVEDSGGAPAAAASRMRAPLLCDVGQGVGTSSSGGGSHNHQHDHHDRDRTEATEERDDEDRDDRAALLSPSVSGLRGQHLTAEDEASRPFYLKTFWKLTLLMVLLYVFLGSQLDFFVMNGGVVQCYYNDKCMKPFFIPGGGNARARRAEGVGGGKGKGEREKGWGRAPRNGGTESNGCTLQSSGS